MCASIVPELRGRRGAAGCQLTRCRSSDSGFFGVFVGARQSGAVLETTGNVALLGSPLLYCHCDGLLCWGCSTGTAPSSHWELGAQELLGVTSEPGHCYSGILTPPEHGEAMENPGKPWKPQGDPFGCAGCGKAALAVISSWEEITAAFQRLGGSTPQILACQWCQGKGLTQLC